MRWEVRCISHRRSRSRWRNWGQMLECIQLKGVVAGCTPDNASTLPCALHHLAWKICFCTNLHMNMRALCTLYSCALCVLFFELHGAVAETLRQKIPLRYLTLWYVLKTNCKNNTVQCVTIAEHSSVAGIRYSQSSVSTLEQLSGLIVACAGPENRICYIWMTFLQCVFSKLSGEIVACAGPESLDKAGSATFHLLIRKLKNENWQSPSGSWILHDLFHIYGTILQRHLFKSCIYSDLPHWQYFGEKFVTLRSDCECCHLT